ncbi:MAG: FAD-binding protein, partial [Firmicutes bacterium]|nr:FAD-binding protein [Bacillota bacterium]
MKVNEKAMYCAVVGSGAAGLSAAARLWQGGVRDIAVITEDLKAGTSRNTGSDKQTYYKLSLAAGDRDRVLDMAEDLFAGGCVDGDTALCEAALSARCFFSLLELGVPFPDTQYGEFMGYKTDHDRGRRATSAGPYTSRLMTESLEKYVLEQGIPVLDGLQMIKLLVSGGRVRGLLCLDTKAQKEEYVIIWCPNVILATGGPAGMYRDSVYPVSQLGSSGAAFEAGALGKNLTEWQFGMASLRPRWNVSGSYMQVLPRFVSADKDGSDEREFLSEFYKDPGEMNSAVFLKGYQWPFDAAKAMGGSSVIDLLVYRETVMRGRRVFLDFTKNAGGKETDFSSLSDEARAYLEQADVCFGTPIERLSKMNLPAVNFYLDHGVDLRREKLEIAVCAQHNNGGLSADAGWETCVKGLFAVGELCGSHGVTRPGGSALNAGQVGALRAAGRVRLRKLHEEEPKLDETMKTALRKEAESFARLPSEVRGDIPASALREGAAARMSASGGMIRSKEG